MDDIRRGMRFITRIAQSYTSKALKHSDLNASETQLVRTVTFNPHITQTDLATRLGIDKAAVTRLLLSLEKKGYITRVADEKDGRIKRAVATPRGEAVKDELIAAETDFYKQIFNGIAAAELDAFADVLQRALAEARGQKDEGFKGLLSKDNEGADK